MLLFVGLGNPEQKYANDRHNIGFMAVDAIAAAHGLAPWRSRFHGAVAEGQLGGEKVLLLKPATYMNRSGIAVGEAVRFYKLEPDRVFVFHDELDLAPGKLRVKLGGGLAGHNGLRSIAPAIGPDFWRVRLGIGHPGAKEKVTGHVLGAFSKADAAWLAPLLDAVADAAPLLARGDAPGFMSRVALLTRTEAEGAGAAEPTGKAEKGGS